MLLRLAWRNIWRNRRRTIITLAALTLGVTAIVSIHSFREVATGEMIRGITKGLVGHAQIHGRGYQASPDVTTVVSDPVAVEAKLAKLLPGVRSEKRVLGAGLAGAGEAASPAMVMGLDIGGPGVEGLLTITRGRTLAVKPGREAVLGKALADELRVDVGGELVLVGQGADGSLANDRYKVVGLADAGSSEANATAVFLHLADAQSFYALGSGVHQIIVRLPVEPDELAAPVSLMRGALDLTRLEVMPWNEILPELKSAIDAKRRNQSAIFLVVFLIVALGVLNTMTMSTFERVREFGVLASLGTRRRRILAMVVLEALMQGAIGFGVGVGLAWAFLHCVGTVSLSGLTAGTDVMGVRMPDAFRLSLHVPSVVSSAVTAAITVLAGGLIPAIRAARLKPVEATRYV